jgi:hypothetical protein
MSQPWTHTAGAKAYPRINEHYVEPSWVSERLFEEETFIGGVFDPACGFGRIVESAVEHGLDAYGSDIVDRGNGYPIANFFDTTDMHDSVVSNPPFDVFEKFAIRALTLARDKVALIMPTARLNAAHWLEETPLRRVWLLTPRPSMPPGHVITNKGKVGGGKSDYCWIVMEHGYSGKPEMQWLHRDEA